MDWQAVLLHLQAGAKLAVPRMAERVCWDGRRQAEMQRGGTHGLAGARRGGEALKLDAYACPRQPAGSPPCDAGGGRRETLGGVDPCLVGYCPLRAAHLRSQPA